ncbi:hypothetical protein HanRHA438_Chr15g0728671 [Helianthus annuus]|nr:hypothetical protein HanRHA438_Chr15g0728671 [Helianthus annuus]
MSSFYIHCNFHIHAHDHEEEKLISSLDLNESNLLNSKKFDTQGKPLNNKMETDILHRRRGTSALQTNSHVDTNPKTQHPTRSLTMIKDQTQEPLKFKNANNRCVFDYTGKI